MKRHKDKKNRPGASTDKIPPGACRAEQSSPAGNEPEAERYAFMNMYRKLSRRRICLLLLLPLLYIAALAVLLPILSGGMLSWQLLFMLFQHRPMQLAFLPTVLIPSLISLRIYLSSSRNMDTLQQVYDRSRRQELERIDSIRERQAAYVFNGEYLVNWDGSLNIVPLKEIKKIEYIRYFYLILRGTRLRILCDKKYVIWAHGPSGAEWIERGFVLPDGQSGTSVSLDVNLPT